MSELNPNSESFVPKSDVIVEEEEGQDGDLKFTHCEKTDNFEEDIEKDESVDSNDCLSEEEIEVNLGVSEALMLCPVTFKNATASALILSLIHI